MKWVGLLVVCGLLAFVPVLMPFAVLVGLGVAAVMVVRALRNPYRKPKEGPERPRVGNLGDFEDLLNAGLLIDQEEVPEALLLGSTVDGTLVGVVRVEERPNLGHLVVVGPSQSGKSSMAEFQLLLWNGPAIISDPRGDLYRSTGGARARFGPVRVIDAANGRGTRYDPLAARIGASTLRRWARDTCYLPADETSGGAHYQTAAADSLMRLVTNAREKGLPVWPYVANNANGSLRERLGGLLDALPTLSGTDVSGSDFRGPTSLFFLWPEGSETASLVNGLLVSLVREIVSDRDTSGDRTPLLVLLDEAASLALPDLPSLAAEVAGRGITLWLSLQAVSQLETLYGAPGAATVLESMHSAVYFRPLSYDAAEGLSKRIGQHLVIRQAQGQGWHATNTPWLGLPSSHVSQMEMLQPILPPEHLLRLQDNEVIMFSREAAPTILHRLDWRQDDELRRRRDIEPAEVPQLPEPPGEWAILVQAPSAKTPSAAGGEHNTMAGGESAGGRVKRRGPRVVLSKVLSKDEKYVRGLKARLGETVETTPLVNGKRCRAWTGAVDDERRPIYGARKEAAARQLVRALRGVFPTEFEVHHQCSQPWCVEVAHLEPMPVAEHDRIEAEHVGIERERAKLRKQREANG